jgi:hypothetical protein
MAWERTLPVCSRERNTDDTDLTDYTDPRRLGSDTYHPSDPSDPCSILCSKTHAYRRCGKHTHHYHYCFITLPPFMTNFTCSNSVMSSRGFPSTAIISA